MVPGDSGDRGGPGLRWRHRACVFRLANFKTIIIVREDLVPFFQRECGVAVTFRRAELVA
jgi:hypothetical protein